MTHARGRSVTRFRLHKRGEKGLCMEEPAHLWEMCKGMVRVCPSGFSTFVHGLFHPLMLSCEDEKVYPLVYRSPCPWADD